MPAARPFAASERFGQLTLLEDAPNGSVDILCRCDCGREVRVRGSNLRSGNSTSCGSCWREGPGNGRYSHGMAGTRIYNIWCDMIGRCTRLTHARYADYGGRGITVCAGWRDFAAFYADMGNRPAGRSLDRKDNDGGYWCGRCPECVSAGRPRNCRWATLIQQRRNRRPQRPRVHSQKGTVAA